MNEIIKLSSKESVGINPYVVSEDISLLLFDWASKKGFTLPNKTFFDGLRRDFTSMFSQVFDAFELVPELELKDGLTDIVNKSGLYPVSLDRVYYQSKQSLDITRYVDPSGLDKGLGRRLDSQPLLTQFGNLRSNGITEIILVDDVIFSGDLINRVGNLLKKMGVRVPVVATGIGVQEGIEKLNGLGQDVRCVKKYDSVIDEICERDFYPGVPLCGRSLVGEQNMGVPYILPFGNPQKWASIPEDSMTSLSRFCIDQTIQLFESIEQCTRKNVQCDDLGRGVIGFPINNVRFVDALRSINI